MSDNPNLSRDKQEVIDFLISDFSFFKDIVGLYYNLNEKLIKEYIDKWNWYSLTHNENLVWSEGLIEKFINKWCWNGYDEYKRDGLSTNKALPWSEHLIDKYKDRWNWTGLSLNSNLPWTEKFIDKYKGNWDWYWMRYNNGFPWSERYVEKYESLFTEELSEIRRSHWSDDEYTGHNYHHSEINLVEDYIKDEMDRHDWYKLSSDKNLQWTEDIIEKYTDNWNWEQLSANESIPWSLKFIKTHIRKINSSYLHENKGCWQKVFQPYLDDSMIKEIMGSRLITK